MGTPEIGRGIPVNTSEQTSNGLQLSAVGETYIPRKLDPKTTKDHEAIHAGLGGDVDLVTIVPGPGYNGLTRLRRPSALAAIGPHAMGAHGTGWDVKVAGHIHGSTGGLESSARQAVKEKHGEIVEISDELGKKRVLYGNDVDAARKRARMKAKYGEYATAIARDETGDEVRVRVKVDGDKASVPKEIVDFSARVKARQLEQDAQKALVIEKQKAKPEVTTALGNTEDVAASQLPRGREAIVSQIKEQSGSYPLDTNTNDNVLSSAEEIINAEFARIQEEEQVQQVRDELMKMQQLQAA